MRVTVTNSLGTLVKARARVDEYCHDLPTYRNLENGDP